MYEKTVFEETKHNIRLSSNSNFDFGKIDWATRMWLIEICKVMDDRLASIHRKNNGKFNTTIKEINDSN